MSLWNNVIIGVINLIKVKDMDDLKNIINQIKREQIKRENELQQNRQTTKDLIILNMVLALLEKYGEKISILEEKIKNLDCIND